MEPPVGSIPLYASTRKRQRPAEIQSELPGPSNAVLPPEAHKEETKTPTFEKFKGNKSVFVLKNNVGTNGKTPRMVSPVMDTSKEEDVGRLARLSEHVAFQCFDPDDVIRLRCLRCLENEGVATIFRDQMRKLSLRKEDVELADCLRKENDQLLEKLHLSQEESRQRADDNTALKARVQELENSLKIAEGRIRSENLMVDMYKSVVKSNEDLRKRLEASDNQQREKCAQMESKHSKELAEVKKVFQISLQKMQLKAKKEDQDARQQMDDKITTLQKSLGEAEAKLQSRTAVEDLQKSILNSFEKMKIDHANAEQMAHRERTQRIEDENNRLRAEKMHLEYLVAGLNKMTAHLRGALMSASACSSQALQSSAQSLGALMTPVSSRPPTENSHSTVRVIKHQAGDEHVDQQAPGKVNDEDLQLFMGAAIELHQSNGSTTSSSSSPGCIKQA